ncbi:uncharacterized protein LY79DRAFT_538340 [Colletotrichum navitas]|uniref:Uncharacterized protein n=1 Tax=Colletotrichum navitas TaxID=681940 RepID=A0AAD8Q984_9PEZI|nr:uncharacterized protein LY79DRAFT_538340 [Colletotrichum navitas]KAK1598150.1 hypothetical protein LY79DRAFT_538340 [Colletotrichum navitas]
MLHLLIDVASRYEDPYESMSLGAQTITHSGQFDEDLEKKKTLFNARPPKFVDSPGETSDGQGLSFPPPSRVIPAELPLPQPTSASMLYPNSGWILPLSPRRYCSSGLRRCRWTRRSLLLFSILGEGKLIRWFLLYIRPAVKMVRLCAWRSMASSHGHARAH